MKQLEGQDLDTSTLVPIDVSSAVMKEVSAEWLTDLAEYMANNPQIVNGFEITAALSGNDTAEENPSDSCSEGSREDECEDYASEDEEFDCAE